MSAIPARLDPQENLQGRRDRRRDASVLFKARFAAALRRRIDAGQVTVRDICDVCAVSHQNVSQWLDERTEPRSWCFLRLVQLFGPAFQDECAGVVRLGAE